MSHYDPTEKGVNVPIQMQMNNIVENNNLKQMPENWELDMSNVEIELLSNQPRL